MNWELYLILIETVFKERRVDFVVVIVCLNLCIVIDRIVEIIRYLTLINDNLNLKIYI